MSDAIITIEGLSKTYGVGPNRVEVLKSIDLEVKRGEILSVIGPSGAGKSTLLNLLGCLDNFERGKLFILGKELSELSVDELSSFRNRHLGFIFQLHNLLPEFTALENVMIPLLIRRVNRKDARMMALELLKKFGLENRQNHKPGEMSGGECQRIAVARAIVGKPDLILADEPTGSLDSVNSLKLMDILIELCRESGRTAIIVTHDMKIAEKADRVLSMIDGQVILENNIE